MKPANANTQYIIPFSGLSNGEHIFNYNIKDSFFKALDFSEIKHGDLSVAINLNKQNGMLISVIKINGYVDEVCDRCGENFNLSLNTERQLIFKTGSAELIEEEEIIYLPAAEHEIDFTHHIYESIILSLPLKRIHPEDSKGKSTCDPEALKKLEELSVHEEATTDPRWAALKNIKIN